MTEHTISLQSGILLGDVYGCSCGAVLADRMTAELHATENNRCTVCLGSAEEPVTGGLVRGCTACAGTGRRREQMVWQLAYGEAEQLITLSMVRGMVAETEEPFHLSEVADAVRSALDLPAGRLPVGPRVRDLLLAMEAVGEIVMVSAPDELLDGTDVVLFRDPQWQRVRSLSG